MGWLAVGIILIRCICQSVRQWYLRRVHGGQHVRRDQALSILRGHVRLPRHLLDVRRRHGRGGHLRRAQPPREQGPEPRQDGGQDDRHRRQSQERWWRCVCLTHIYAENYVPVFIMWINNVIDTIYKSTISKR